MCILHHIQSNTELYGYDIMKYMNIHFPEVNESTFYSILRRLHKNDMTSIVYKDISNGPQRKYYKITQKGNLLLEDNIAEWSNLVKIVGDIGIECE